MAAIAAAAAGVGAVDWPPSGAVASAVGPPVTIHLHTTSLASDAARNVAPSGGVSIAAAAPRKYRRSVSSHALPGTVAAASTSGASATASASVVDGWPLACDANKGVNIAPTNAAAHASSPDANAAASAEGVGGAASAGARSSGPTPRSLFLLGLRARRVAPPSSSSSSSRSSGGAKSASRNRSTNPQTSRRSPCLL